VHCLGFLAPDGGIAGKDLVNLRAHVDGDDGGCRRTLSGQQGRAAFGRGGVAAFPTSGLFIGAAALCGRLAGFFVIAQCPGQFGGVAGGAGAGSGEQLLHRSKEAGITVDQFQFPLAPLLRGGWGLVPVLEPFGGHLVVGEVGEVHAVVPVQGKCGAPRA
jgi:hypothetical protein